MINTQIPDAAAIISAYDLIKPYINRTPVLTCSMFNRMFDCELFFKCESFQKVGAFKYRGATNAVFSMPDNEIKNGVATHSSGNFAQALSLAAKMRGVKAYIVMPSNSPKVKSNAVRDYGGEIIFCTPTLQARETTLAEVVEKTNAVFVHPYNDYKIIAGQATACYELINEINKLDIISAPVGGGGLLSGTLLSAHYFSSATKVIACEPELANDAWQSLKAGKIIPSVNPNTIADGLKTSLGDKTFPIIKEYVAEIVTVSEKAIVEAMKLVWERMKIIIEPSAAVTFAALLENKYDHKGKRIGIIFSGGNVDLEKLPWM
ncbi:MAG: pyridoxal-phosphate dependent enzyme [Bacteroidales bacterium]|nr:pyridoxal-phosphate dependent enzyme [Bacteroidales bacterium]